MRNKVKATLSTLGLVAVVAGFSTDSAAIAWTLSPDANTLAFGNTVVTGVNQINFQNDQTQPPGIYGAGFSVAGGNSQSVTFDADLYTWDSYNPNIGTGTGTGYYDGFMVSVSTLGYYWSIPGLDPQNPGPNTALWSWGGTNWSDGILESYVTAPGGTDTLTLITGEPNTYFISLALDTSTSDVFNPSWGSLHVSVPEPSILALFGIGLLGISLAGRVRREQQL